MDKRAIELSTIKKIDLTQLEPISLSAFYCANTKNQSDHPLINDLESEISKTDFFFSSSKSRRTYPGSSKKILLPVKGMHINCRLDDAILNRSSIKTFRKSRVSIEDLSRLLYFSAGTNRQYEAKIAGRKITWSAHTFPSGGCIHSLSTYIFPYSIDKLQHAIYHYDPSQHALEKLKAISKEEVAKTVVSGNNLPNALAIIYITSRIDKTKDKYSERGFRYVLQETGHLMQNLCLVAVSLGLTILPLGGFYEKHIEKILNIDGNQEQVLYVGVLGKPDRKQKRISITELRKNGTIGDEDYSV